MFKLSGTLFILKLYARVEIFTDIICIWNELFSEEAYFNA